MSEVFFTQYTVNTYTDFTKFERISNEVVEEHSEAEEAAAHSPLF